MPLQYAKHSFCIVKEVVPPLASLATTTQTSATVVELQPAVQL
jgi:hypothetical protein